MLYRKLTIHLACALTLACSATSPLSEPSSVLPGSRWRLIAMDGQALEHRALPTIEFTELGVIGDTGCNRYAGASVLDGDSFSISRIEVTHRACSATIQDREERYIELLLSARHLELTSNFLAIFCTDANSPLRFARLR